MRDIVITGRRLATEAGWLAVCFALALAVNVYSIVHFNTQWKELLTTLHLTLLLALVFWFVLGCVRCVVINFRSRLLKR